MIFLTSSVVLFAGGNGNVRPTIAHYALDLVKDKLSGEVVTLNSPEAISSTDIKLNWNVSVLDRIE